MENIEKEKNFVGLSDFVKRQTEESRFSYYKGTWSELQELVEENYKNGNVEKGYRDGVVLVTVPNEGFYTSICKLDENSIIETTVIKRQTFEEPYASSVVVNGSKQESKLTKVVLYSHEVLEEDNSANSNAAWEIISVNCEPYPKSSPIDPVTMVRNQLNKPGGTKAEYSLDEYLESIYFWSNHGLFKGNN